MCKYKYEFGDIVTYLGVQCRITDRFIDCGKVCYEVDGKYIVFEEELIK